MLGLSPLAALLPLLLANLAAAIESSEVPALRVKAARVLKPSLLAVQAKHGQRTLRRKSGKAPPTVADELRDAAFAHQEAANAIRDAAVALKETAHSLKEGAEEVAAVDEEQHALKTAIKVHIAQSSEELAKLEAAVMAPTIASESSEGEATPASGPAAAVEPAAEEEEAPAESEAEPEAAEPAGAPAAAEAAAEEPVPPEAEPAAPEGATVEPISTPEEAPAEEEATAEGGGEEPEE